MGIWDSIRYAKMIAGDVAVEVAGTALKGVGGVVMNTLDSVGMGMMKAGKVAGKTVENAAIKTGKGVYKGGKDFARGLTSENPAMNPLGYAADRFYNFSKGVGYWEHGKSEYDAVSNSVKHTVPGVRFTKKGLGILAGIAGISGVVGAKDNYMANRVGHIESGTKTATPDLGDRQYRRQLTAEDTGATGDLVFALHNLRH